MPEGLRILCAGLPQVLQAVAAAEGAHAQGARTEKGLFEILR